MGKQGHRWALVGAFVAALTATSVAGAGHDGSNVFHLGQINTTGNAVVELPADGISVGRFVQQFPTHTGVGVRGVHAHTAGDGPGVLGETDSVSTNAVGVLGRANPTSAGGFSAGVRGINNGTGGVGAGVIGEHAGTGAAVFGTTVNGTGVFGTHGSSFGDLPGVLGQTFSEHSDAAGVKGVAMSTFEGFGAGYGVWGANNALNGTGVYGTAKRVGVYGVQSGGTGPGPFYGVEGVSGSGTADSAGVRGRIDSNAANAAGVRGDNTRSSCCGMGVAGFHAGAGIGVYGEALNGFAVSGFSPNNWSGYFQGSVRVVGNLQKNSGSFTIDHPLDPQNKYLSHSFVESPDMMNVYNGNVRTDERGFATVKLPRYFSALNRDFRYQLTVVGHTVSDAQVWDEIARNRFTIRTSKPRVKVSWQVTGIRKDRWANAHRIKVEEAKKPSERGRYLNPELYGKPAAKSVVVLPGMTKP